MRCCRACAVAGADLPGRRPGVGLGTWQAAHTVPVRLALCDRRHRVRAHLGTQGLGGVGRLHSGSRQPAAAEVPLAQLPWPGEAPSQLHGRALQGT